MPHERVNAGLPTMSKLERNMHRHDYLESDGLRRIQVYISKSTHDLIKAKSQHRPMQSIWLDAINKGLPLVDEQLAAQEQKTNFLLGKETAYTSLTMSIKTFEKAQQLAVDKNVTMRSIWETATVLGLSSEQ